MKSGDTEQDRVSGRFHLRVFQWRAGVRMSGGTRDNHDCGANIVAPMLSAIAALNKSAKMAFQ